MENDAINIFRKVLDDSDNILKDIRTEVFEKLDLGKYDQLNEFVKESLEHFSFNISESQFFEQIRTVVDEAMTKDNLKIKNGETIDYNLFASNLMNQLKTIGQVNLNFDDDFRNLAKNINDKFPLIASDNWYSRLSSKKEQIITMINKYNQDIVETLIKLTSQLASELSAMDSKAKSNTNSNVSQNFQQPAQQSQDQQTLSPQQTEQVLVEQEKKMKDRLVQDIVNAMNKAGEMIWGDIDIDERISRMNNIRNRLYAKSIDDLQLLLSTYQGQKKEENFQSIQEQQINNQTTGSQSTPQNNIDNEQLISNFVKRCSEKLNEVDIMFKNGGGSKSEIAKGFRALQKFINDLNDKNFAQEILNRYIKINDVVQGTIYDEIIFQNIPMLKEIYDKHKGLLDEEQIRKPNQPTDQKAPKQMENYVGASNEEIRDLINQNKYYSILHGISKENVVNYYGFINSGYQMIVNDYLTRANNAKTYEEKHNAYFELYEIYQNFRDYLSIEASSQLKEQLDSMYSYLQQQAQANEDTGIRYNSSKVESSNSTMKR